MLLSSYPLSKLGTAYSNRKQDTPLQRVAPKALLFHSTEFKSTVIHMSLQVVNFVRYSEPISRYQ